MARSGQKERWILYILAVLLCLVLASFWLMCNIYARYTAEGSGSDEARVAFFGSNQSIILAESDQLPQVPGESCDYTLSISNQNQKTSEVTQKYSIEVVTEGNLPLQYSLYRDNTQVGESFFETANQKAWKIQDASMVFQAGEDGIHTYTLRVTWPDGQNASSLAGIPDAIQINICTEQVD